MSDDTDERVPLTVEQALGMLKVKNDRVHTFINPNGMLIGADWSLELARKCFEENGAELAGEAATRMKHGVVSMEGGVRAVFFETTEKVTTEVGS